MTMTSYASPLRKLYRPAMFAAVFLLAACGKEVAQVVALEPGKDTACALDGMVLVDYPGPKAQMHFAEGAPEFFCDVTELFAMVLAPEQRRPVKAMFVQDMGKADWAQPQGHWIDAKAAYYVVGSKKHGSMGETFGTFAAEQDAQAFAQKEGGAVKRFEQITLEMVDKNTGSASHDSKMH